LIALLLATVLVFLILPYIANLSQRNLQPILLQHPGIIVSVIAGSILVGLISGIYPAIYLSSFQPSKVLKGGALSVNKKANFRNILVVGQFVSAIFLIIARFLSSGSLITWHRIPVYRDRCNSFSR
jgi:putative ABC transport system permease protein